MPNDHTEDGSTLTNLDGSKNIQLDKDKMPKHVAIICDGNRRAARILGLPDLKGHQSGAENIVRLLRDAKKLGIPFVTLWGFSTENWKRTGTEVSYLMGLFESKIKELAKEFLEDGVRFKHIGRKDRLPKRLLAKIEELEEKTAKFTERCVTVAIDYGGQDEIVRAVKKIIEDKVDPSKIDEAMFSSYLDTAGLPDVDMLIRTGGEHRTSGYLPWQSTYAEYFFPQTFLPNFKLNEFKKLLFEYQNRDRRFGKDSKTEDEKFKLVSKV